MLDTFEVSSYAASSSQEAAVNRFSSNFANTVLVFILAMCPFMAHTQQATQEQYKYDPLGRLTRVDVNGQIKVAYCYDKAGNRKSLSAQGGQIQDCSDTPQVYSTPPVPTNLGQGTHQGGGCYIRWSAPTDAGISHFQVRLATGGTILTVAGNLRYYDHNTSCFSWIKACNAQQVCSESANFR